MGADDLLRRALEELEIHGDRSTWFWIEEIRAYLDAPKDERAACKRCGGSGVVDDGEIDCYPDGTPYLNGPVKCVKDCPDCHPPRPMKPMTHEEIAYGFTEPRHSQWQAFVAGVRWSESHHGISGGSDE